MIQNVGAFNPAMLIRQYLKGEVVALPFFYIWFYLPIKKKFKIIFLLVKKRSLLKRGAKEVAQEVQGKST